MKKTPLFLIAALFLLQSCGQSSGNAPDYFVPCTSCIIFETTETYMGSLGGVTGADAKCMTDTNYPGSGTYKAMIVDGSTRVACTSANCATSGVSEHLNWVLHASTPYYRPDGTSIGTTTSNGIFSFPLVDPISTHGYTAATGLSTTWTGDPNNCSKWTSSNGVAYNTAAGADNATSNASIDTTTYDCGLTFSFYCVQQ